MVGQGINGVRESLRAQQQLLNIEAGNLMRSQIPGSQAVRGTLADTSTVRIGGKTLPGTATRLGATSIDFSQGSIQRTGFTTDLAISGKGFFTLFDSKGEFYYTRDGSFHFDTNGVLVNSQGLFVASFDHQTNALEKTSIKVNPVTDALGEQVLAELEANGAQQAADIATALGEPLADVTASLGTLSGAGYVNSFLDGGNTFYKSNLGQLGDQVLFDREGFVINETRGLKRGNQIALAKFDNEQGLVPGRFGGNIYKATEAAAPGGIPEYGAPGDTSMGLGSIEGQALEQSTSSATPSLVKMGFLQRNFTATSKAMTVFLKAWDDLLANIR